MRYATDASNALFCSQPPQDNPIYTYRSERVELALQLSDNYEARNQMLTLLQRDSGNWFELALNRAPMELHSTLQVSGFEFSL